jgi:hypothetical protein
MTKYHPVLTSNDVHVDYIFCHGDLTHQGYAAAAVVKKIGLKDRACGRADAEIVICHDVWDRFTDEQRVALLDHELTHLAVATDSDGFPRRDDLGRPVLKMVKHDHQFGWFDSVVRRHGGNSLEAIAARQFKVQYGQLYFEFEPEEQLS